MSGEIFKTLQSGAPLLISAKECSQICNIAYNAYENLKIAERSSMVKEEDKSVIREKLF